AGAGRRGPPSGRRRPVPSRSGGARHRQAATAAGGPGGEAGAFSFAEAGGATPGSAFRRKRRGRGRWRGGPRPADLAGRRNHPKSETLQLLLRRIPGPTGGTQRRGENVLALAGLDRGDGAPGVGGAGALV